MELPNHSTPDPNDELDELLINTALDILVERAEGGDERSRILLDKCEATLSAGLDALTVAGNGAKERYEKCRADLQSTVERFEAEPNGKRT